MSAAQRLSMMQAIQRGPGRRIERDFGHWNNVEAVIEQFIANDLGAPGTWTGEVDAVVLEGMVRGLAVALGHSDDTNGNPGVPLWARYLVDVRNGRLDEKARRNVAWSRADTASVDWGVRNTSLKPTVPEKTLYQTSEGYRATLRNEPAIMRVLHRINRPQLTRCYNWLTDVTNREAVRTSLPIALALSRAPHDPRAISSALVRLSTAYPQCTRWTPSRPAR
jgi:hypothetical protein